MDWVKYIWYCYILVSIVFLQKDQVLVLLTSPHNCCLNNQVMIFTSKETLSIF